MMPKQLTSKELITMTGISRATLYNYVSLGILPKPQIKAPEKGHGRAKRLGYFPISSVNVVAKVSELKRKGKQMSEIIAELANKKHQHITESNEDNFAEEFEEKAEPFISPIKMKPDSKSRPTTSLPSQHVINLDSVSGPAYMVNNQFQIEWANEAANDKLFHLERGLSKDITECSVFPLLVTQEQISLAVDRDEILRFHLMAAKNRIPRAHFYSLGALMDDHDVETLLRTYDEAEPADRAALLHTTVNMAPAGSPPAWHIIYASFFREGVFFTFEPSQSPSDSLLELLARRDIVIRELLKRRRPYLTPLAVMVADIQNSVKICAELPPEEYFELINQIWSVMEPVLRKYNATHGKHVGDGLLCYFFPQPDSNYILNALRCSLEMQKALKKINNEWLGRKVWANELLLNTGIDEGQEWFGTYQTNTHLEFTVLGDTVNRCGRLSDFAKGGTIWASKNLVGRLSQTEREIIRYGVHRTNAEGDKVFVDSTFSRISNLVDLELPQNQKLTDLGSLPVTEITEIINPNVLDHR